MYADAGDRFHDGALASRAALYDTREGAAGKGEGYIGSTSYSRTLSSPHNHTPLSTLASTHLCPQVVEAAVTLPVIYVAVCCATCVRVSVCVAVWAVFCGT